MVFQRCICCCIALLTSFSGLTQKLKVVDELIPRAEQKRVERAKKLFNEYKIFEGERILKDLVKEHPNTPYYREALVQLQRQVLYHVLAAAPELERLQPKHLEVDSNDMEFEQDSLFLKSNETKVKQEISLSDFGLDVNTNKKETRAEKKEARKEKKLQKEILEEQQDAVVTIDSTLLQPTDEDELTEAERKKRNEEKALKQKLKALNDIALIPYDSYKASLIQHAREATLAMPDVDSCSHYLRYFLLDTLPVDKDVPHEARTLFEEGMEALQNNELPSATKHLEAAIALHENYYSALLALGDVYYLMNKDTAAMKRYSWAAELEPTRPEPLEKLAMANYNRGKYIDAAANCIDAICLYPEQKFNKLLKRIINKTGLDFSLQWIQRPVYPLTTAHVYEEIVADDKSPWWHYQASKQDVYSYFDINGIVRPNEKTNERYLEVYGWKRMLNNTGVQHFPFARAMEQLGYLDCYVLISLFHHDLYGQFIDLTKRNPDKVRDYFYVLINWEDKKFDKLRKKFMSQTSDKKKG